MITSGEPSLAPHKIEMIHSLVRETQMQDRELLLLYQCKKYNPVFLKALENLYRFCENPKKCALTITTDQFHEPYSREATEQYRASAFYNPINVKGEILKTAAINRGSAKENGIGFFNRDVPDTNSIYKA